MVHPLYLHYDYFRGSQASTASNSTAAVSSTHIDDLPDDCMMLIFSYFSELQKMQVERGENDNAFSCYRAY